MKKNLIICLITILGLSAHAQNYRDYKTLTEDLKAIAASNASLLKVNSIAKTAGGYDIHVITAGTGDMDSKPGIAIIGGIEGNYLLGREITSRLAEALVKDHQDLLKEVTFYIFPDVSPDASAQYFSKLLYERKVNAGATDDDRDFVSGEDPYEDINKDGIISYIRVTDAAGTFVADPDDERIMREADISKGETGGYFYFPEGIDNDDDGKYNEDGEGGVNFNRNFTFDFEEFGAGSGVHAVSEPETKAIADFLYDRYNIFAVFVFGPQDNLGQPMKTGPQGQDRRLISIMPSDETINKLLSDRYHEVSGLKGAPVQVKTPGNFMDWAYFHYGRYSFSTPGWWFPVEKGKNPESEFMKYAEKNNMKDVFLPWKEISHPDFPGKKVEVGGLRPFVMSNPPADSVQVMVKKNIDFLVTMAAMHPALEFNEINTENLGNDIYRIEIKVLNKGVFATMPQVAVNNIWTRIMRLAVEPSKGQEIMSGRKIQRIARLGGGESADFSWLIKGKGAIKISAGAVNTGIITTTAELK